MQNRQSITAFSVLQGFIRALELEYNQWFDPYELILAKHIINIAIQQETNCLNRNILASFTALPYHWQRGFFNRFVVPHYDAHMAGRKLFLRQKIEKSIQEGCNAVIFLGAGLDPYAYLAAQKFPETLFYELDFGKTREIKQSALRDMPDIIPYDTLCHEYDENNCRINANLFLLEFDIRVHDLPSLLEQYDFCKERKTLIILEGVTTYLTKAVLENLLSGINSILNNESELILSFTDKHSEENISALHREAVYRAGEHYLTSMAPEEVPYFMQQNGFTVQAKLLDADLKKQLGILPEDTHAEENYFLSKKSASLMEYVAYDEEELAQIEDVELDLDNQNQLSFS